MSPLELSPFLVLCLSPDVVTTDSNQSLCAITVTTATAASAGHD